METIGSHFEKVNNIASKCIIGVEYLDDKQPVQKFVTLNTDIIGGEYNKNIDYNYKNNNGSYYRFFDVIQKVWFEYSIKQQLSYHYYCIDAAGLEDTVELYFLNDKDKINLINNEVIKIVDEFIDTNDKLLSDIVKYNKNYSKELFNNYSYLLFNNILTYEEVLFSIVFNITLDEYKNDKIKDIEYFKDVYVDVIEVYKQKAIETIKGEIDESSLDEDDINELELICSMISSAVDESNVSRQGEIEPLVILEEYPPILFPIPNFIEYENGDSVYLKCKVKVQRLLQDANT
tara:strand:- start:4212 stop:5081 length:870 start_codon:yes stop_codon:yes gene_type:complete